MAVDSSPWTFERESTRVGGADIVTLVDGSTFMLSGRSGDVSGQGAEGLFMLDTRVLSRWVVGVDGRRVEPLSVTPEGPFAATFVGRVCTHESVDAPIVVIQRRHVGRGLRESLEIRHHGSGRVPLIITLDVGADFHGLFAAKEGRDPEHPVGVATATPDGATIEPAARIGSTSADERSAPGPWSGGSPVELVTVRSTVPPDVGPDRRADAGRLRWSVELGPGETWSTCIGVEIAAAGERIVPTVSCDADVEHAIPVARLRSWLNTTTRVETDHAALDRAVSRAIEDLGALRIFDPDHAERLVVAAGAPWFMTLFGRDSLITSWMTLPIDHSLARGVLGELRDAQGSIVDPTIDEQPGRILHEVRFDRLSARLLGGSGRYYGSIDATPLFVMLVGEMCRWTGGTPEIRSLIPAVDRALAWIDRFGDRDDDGFVEYLRGDAHGLEHQGWKDSFDGIRHADGSIAVPPIALCEVQGYVYAAHRARALLARALGEGESAAAAHDRRAEQLRERFDEAFWLADEGWYAVGLDADKHPIRSLTSNLGHLLWTGIVPENRAGRLAELLVSPRLFSGWGIRTLAEGSPGYNPMSYHCGSVWPHDTAIAIAGLARYEYDAQAQALLAGLLDASTWSSGRLPELFAGFDRHDVMSPVPYPASCSPQAWASGSPLLIVRSLLGLEPDVAAGRLHLRPRLPPDIGYLQLLNIPLGSARVNITVRGQDVDVVVSSGDVAIEIT